MELDHLNRHSAWRAQAVLVAVLALGPGPLASCAPECHNHIASAQGQEESGYLAVVFFRNCGVGSNFNTQVSISPRDDAFPDGSGNAFIASFPHSSPKYDTGAPKVNVRWLSGKALLIEYDRDARVAKAERRVGAILVTYQAR
ncbi:MAG: hypothetical protein QOH86_1128 [Sphingomonadales bacterium]|nr:hypothetical protein [Sphingomonadales bacterium]